MAKYSIYAMFTASKHIGTFEADSPEEAEEMAVNLGDDSVILCWQCSREVELGECYEYQTEEVK